MLSTRSINCSIKAGLNQINGPRTIKKVSSYDLREYAEISKTRKSKALVANDLAQLNFAAPASCSPASERGGADAARNWKLAACMQGELRRGKKQEAIT